jgi:hypothetical protein
MPDPQPSLWANASEWLSGVVLAVVSALGWLLRRHVAAIDEQEERLDQLELKTATKGDLDRTVTEFKEFVSREATETRAELKTVHNRLDTLYRDLLFKGRDHV